MSSSSLPLPPTDLPLENMPPASPTSLSSESLAKREGISLKGSINLRDGNAREGGLSVMAPEFQLSPDKQFNSLEEGLVSEDAGKAPAVISYDENGNVHQPKIIPATKFHIATWNPPTILHQTICEGNRITRKELESRRWSQDLLLLAEGPNGLMRRNKIAVAVMQLYLNSGAALHRMDADFETMVESMGLIHTSVFLFWNGFMVALRHPLTKVHMDTDIYRAPFGLNLGKLSAVNRLVLDMPFLTIEEAEDRCQRIAQKPPLYPKWLKNLVCLPIISITFAPMFYNGDWWSGLFALPLGLITGSLFMLTPYLNPTFSDLTEFIGGVINGFFARLITGYAGNFCFNSTVMAGCIWLIPGIPLTLGILQLVSKDTANGVNRVFSALITLMMLGTGIGLGSYLASLIPTVGQFVEYQNTNNISCNSISNFYDFILYPISAIATVIVIEAEYWQWPLVIIPAGLSFGAWTALQEAQFTGLPFIIVVLVAAMIGGVFGFGWSALTRDSAFPIIYMCFEYIVPGGLALKTVLGDINTDLVPGAGFAGRMIQALFGCMLGTYIAQFLIWPRRSSMYTIKGRID